MKQQTLEAIAEAVSKPEPLSHVVMLWLGGIAALLTIIGTIATLKKRKVR